jgi:hypothetical protein
MSSFPSWVSVLLIDVLCAGRQPVIFTPFALISNWDRSRLLFPISPSKHCVRIDGFPQVLVFVIGQPVLAHIAVLFEGAYDVLAIKMVGQTLSAFFAARGAEVRAARDLVPGLLAAVDILPAT